MRNGPDRVRLIDPHRQLPSRLCWWILIRCSSKLVNPGQRRRSWATGCLLDRIELSQSLCEHVSRLKGLPRDADKARKPTTAENDAMFEDHYQIFGVSRDASQDEIKKAYYALARECHPDLHPNDKDARARFQRIQLAFDVLGDSVRREKYNKQYDAHFRKEPPPPPRNAESNTPTMADSPPVAAFTVARTRSRRQRSAGAEIVRILLGGLVGITIAWSVLWYGFSMDIFGVMQPRDDRTAKSLAQSGPSVLPESEPMPRNVKSGSVPKEPPQIESKPSAQTGEELATNPLKAKSSDRNTESPSAEPPKLSEVSDLPSDSMDTDFSPLAARTIDELRDEVEQLKAELAQVTRTRLVTSRIPTEAVEFQGHRYQAIQTPMTKHLAQEHCESLGGHLVRIESPAEHDFVWGLVQHEKGQEYLVDGADEGTEGKWVFSTGQPITCINWDKTSSIVEPDNFEGREHAMVIRSHSGTIADCSAGTRLAFICEWDLGSETVAGHPVQELSKIQRKAIPPAEIIAKAASTVRQVFAAEYAAAKKPLEKTDFATKLLQVGLDTNDDLASRYVVIRSARNIAMEAGDVDLAFRAMDALYDSFEIDLLAEQAQLVADLAEASLTDKELAKLKPRVAYLRQQAFSADNYSIAGRMNQIARVLGKRKKDDELNQNVDRWDSRLETASSDFGFEQEALKTLNATPDDPGANSKVGRYRCLVKGEWKSGLPYLAKCDDPVLRELASQDLAGVSPEKDELALADGWWSFASTAKDTVKAGALARAGFWYARALEKTNGLTRRKVELQLGEIKSAIGAWGDSVTVPSATSQGQSENPTSPATADLTNAVGMGSKLIPADSVNLGANDGSSVEKSRKPRTTNEVADSERRYWAYDGGYYFKTVGSDWVERVGILSNMFVETERTKDYVEIKQHLNGVLIRMFNGQMLIKNARERDFKHSRNGKWVPVPK